MLKDRLSEMVYKQYRLSEETAYEELEVSAETLLSSKRLDIAAKYLYLSLRRLCPDYARKVYLEHIRCMTKGSYVEPYSNKNTKEKFVDSFEKLVQELQNNGYSPTALPVPIDRNYKIMDGAHRVAACLYLGIPIRVIKIDIEAEYDVYDQSFFLNTGIDNEILDAIMIQYVSINNNCVCLNIWPSATGHDKELYSSINKYFFIDYQKEVSLNENGAFYYLAQIYSEYSWAQNNQNGFSGIYRKLLPCFPTFSPVRVLFLELKDKKNDLITIKEELRNIYELEKHSLHITDSHLDTLQMAKIVLSNNSIDFLNHSNVTAFSNTLKLLGEAKDKAKERRNIVFTGSIVLALYGVRMANDLDYISDDPSDNNAHNQYLPMYGFGMNEALFNPNLQFVFFDLNFLTLSIVKRFKENRGEKKDIEDLNLIRNVLSGNEIGLKVKMIRVRRRMIANIEGFIIRIAHATGTYEVLRTIYKKVLGKGE